MSSLLVCVFVQQLSWVVIHESNTTPIIVIIPSGLIAHHIQTKLNNNMYVTHVLFVRLLHMMKYAAAADAASIDVDIAGIKIIMSMSTYALPFHSVAVTCWVRVRCACV